MTKKKDTLKMVYTVQEIQDILGLSRNGAYKLKHCLNGKVSQAYQGLTVEVLENEK